ncbi:MAG: glycosyltransferase, partial [Candidatus Edwardsbacteria bacterium]|nr:glycosyltransferase [Candidatus Edwardsbacteria bacterium]
MPPFVSIILPVRNEEKFIIPCLQSIFLQDYPSDKFEVIIIDGRSDDSTIDSIAEFKIQNPKSNIIVLDNPKKVVSAGLNIGFKAAKGDIIIRMDAHAAYGRDYISQCLAALEKSGAANVGGPALALPGG